MNVNRRVATFWPTFQVPLSTGNIRPDDQNLNSHQYVRVIVMQTIYHTSLKLRTMFYNYSPDISMIKVIIFGKTIFKML